jgi:general secretion pathway protein L
LQASRIEAPAADGMTILTLDRQGQASPRIDRLLAALCVVLTVASLTIPLVRQQIDRAHLAAQQAALAPNLHEAEALRRRLDAARDGSTTLTHEQLREGDALGALAAITQALPDRSFLTDLSLRHRVATLDGESPNAAGLVATLSANPRFADPAFAAPVTRALNENADIFSIKVTLRRHDPQ